MPATHVASHACRLLSPSHCRQCVAQPAGATFAQPIPPTRPAGAALLCPPRPPLMSTGRRMHAPGLLGMQVIRGHDDPSGGPLRVIMTFRLGKFPPRQALYLVARLDGPPRQPCLTDPPFSAGEPAASRSGAPSRRSAAVRGPSRWPRWASPGRRAPLQLSRCGDTTLFRLYRRAPKEFADKYIIIRPSAKSFEDKKLLGPSANIRVA